MKNTTMRLPRVNHCSKTIEMTECFQHAAAEFGTDEFAYLMDLRAACPDYAILGAQPTKAARNGRKTVPYAKMRIYLGCLRDAHKHLEMFEKVVSFSRSQASPYRTVLKWFRESFPDYGRDPQFHEEGHLIARVCYGPFERMAAEQPETAVPQGDKSNSGQPDAA
jgi:hypothetical protein